MGDCNSFERLADPSLLNFKKGLQYRSVAFCYRICNLSRTVGHSSHLSLGTTFPARARVGRVAEIMHRNHVAAT